MITAIEALSLPTARLSDSDAEAAAKILAIAEAHVRAHMLRTGCLAERAIPVDPSTLNPLIMHEVVRVCRRSGWDAAFQQQVQKSAISGEMTVIGVHLALQPNDLAYEAHDPVARITRNGVAHV